MGAKSDTSIKHGESQDSITSASAKSNTSSISSDDLSCLPKSTGKKFIYPKTLNDLISTGNEEKKRQIGKKIGILDKKMVELKEDLRKKWAEVKRERKEYGETTDGKIEGNKENAKTDFFIALMSNKDIDDRSRKSFGTLDGNLKSYERFAYDESLAKYYEARDDRNEIIEKTRIMLDYAWEMACRCERKRKEVEVVKDNIIQGHLDRRSQSDTSRSRKPLSYRTIQRKFSVYNNMDILNSRSKSSMG
ncbi:unnamed protein product [Bursaphelenchus okinawaensis]|uniref:Uncharacterized protein n=1 Tax=Bursaphelenchus okinawaensis TaxID=465554 RepID=A0A811LE30_9BILA|nr:unnamed protein product [Bursaphelenchus okinawaensis]CAG9121336.1 unnamed protein product [Bursaphelenchus okinawaensis]